MNILIYLVINGLVFAIILTGYLLAIMFCFNPRVWGFSDYPKSITGIVEPQTSEEKKKGVYLSLPFFILGLGYPIISTVWLKQSLGGEIDFFMAFILIFGIQMFGNIADLLILDILIVGTITPKFVVIPGTEHLKETEYKAFRKMHAIGHIRGTIFMALLSVLIAFLIVVF